MTEHRIWDPFLRLFHWSLVILFLANAVFTDPDGTLHEWVGYAIAALIALRLAWGLIGPRPARFASFVPSPAGIRAQLTDMAAARKSAHLGHSPLGALMIFNLIATLIGISVTGYMMTTITFFGVDWVEEAHEVIFGWLIFSIALHVAGVAFDTWRSGVNLVRAMINGKKAIPYGREVE